MKNEIFSCGFQKEGYLLFFYPLLDIGSIYDACYSFSKKVY